jgi:hypothetical protein
MTKHTQDINSLLVEFVEQGPNAIMIFKRTQRKMGIKMVNKNSCAGRAGEARRDTEPVEQRLWCV